MKKFTRTMACCVPGTLYAALSALLTMSGCQKRIEQKALKDFQQVNLVDNNGEYHATHTDPALMNAWGLAWSPTGIAWVNAQAGHVSALYDRDGAAIRKPVNIPSPADTIGGSPTGIVFNGSATDFLISNAKPAAFIFVGDDGVLSGWNGTAGNNALRIHNFPHPSSFTGLTTTMNNGANYLYAADFGAGKIDVWDKNFAPVSMSFTDPHLPSGFSPFNIQVVGNWLLVTYAKVGPDGDDQAGLGNGFVDIFNPDGSFVRRFASRGPLNSPWGITEAPASFFDDNDNDADHTGNDQSGKDDQGKKQDRKNDEPVMLVGNLGDGHINAYGLDGEFLGQLKTHGKAIVIEGLWALSFPPSAAGIDPGRLYFTAGPDDEKDGLFGYLIKQ